MKLETIVPKSEAEWLRLRTQDITSTEVAALFGVSPYTTLFELWHRKKENVVVEFEPTERMKWGNRLQDAIAAGIAEDNGWTIRRMTEYIREPNLKMGASFDFAIQSVNNFNDGGTNDKVNGLLEIKNVDGLAFNQGWSVDGDDVEAPPHIELQVQHQLAVSGRAFAYLAALVGGNRVVLIKREPDPKIIDAIKSQVASFWFSIASGKEPVPDFYRDAKVISKLYGYAEPGKLFDARGDAEFAKLCAEHKALADIENTAKASKEAIKAQLIMKIGAAEKVLGDGFTISANSVGPAHIEYDREGYRNFRINWPRKKAADVAVEATA